MKNSKIIYLLIAVTMLTTSCFPDKIYIEEEKHNCDGENRPITKQINGSSINFACSNVGNNCIIRDKIIVFYKNPNLTEEDKEILRAKNGVKAFEKCSCGDDRLERWIFEIEEGQIIDLKNLVTDISGDDDGDLAGDHEFTIEIYPEKTDKITSSFFTTNTPFNEKFIGDNNNGINIAIIDAGIDYGYIDFNNDNINLYNSSSINCDSPYNITSGWNFSDDNWDPREGYPKELHGIYVTKLITDQANKYKIPVNILPVKAFNRKGRATYWDVICAMNYVNQFNDIHLINTSFGFYNMNNGNIKKTEIFKYIIDELKDKSLIVAAAGNEGINTDDPAFYHYPSSYKSENIISVGGYDGTPKLSGTKVSNITLNYDSNYGEENVDIVAPFTYDFNGDVIFGTSYATPFTSGKLMQKIDRNNYTPITFKTTFLKNSLTSDSLIGLINNQKIVVP